MVEDESVSMKVSKQTVILDNGEVLYDADPNCKHEYDPYCYSGVRCLKCGGWFCL